MCLHVCSFIGEILLFKTQRGVKEKVIFADKTIERYNITPRLPEYLNGVRSAERGLCFCLRWVGCAMKFLDFVLLGDAF